MQVLTFISAVFVTIVSAGNCLANDSGLVVDTKFEGGSARVIEVDQERAFIRIMPGGDPARGWPAWWCFRVSNLTKGQIVTVNVVPSSRPLPAGHPGGGKPLAGSWATPSQATWSADGKTWRQSTRGEPGNAGTTYRIASPGSQLWVAWGPPATPTSMNRWMKTTAKAHPFVESFLLAKTREGREVRGIRIATEHNRSGSRPVVWLQARQHAWESGSSWVARGIGEWLVSDSEQAAWLRKNSVIFLVPIMDVDRAATGDGGKESVPQDHNRDWTKQPHYPEVRAAQQRLLNLDTDERLGVFVDLHNPGPGDRDAYFYVAPDEAMKPPQKAVRSRFLDDVQKAYDGELELRRQTRSTGPSYHPLWNQISCTWVAQQCGENAVAVCLETPWNTPQSTTDGYKSVGVGLMKGIARYLRNSPDSSPE